MNYCIEAMSRYIPPKNAGYRFIKRAIVFIPYQEVGLSILERKEVNLSFVYETILKLLDQGINEIDKMSLLLGLDQDIYKEIIAQMAVEDMITISGMSITLAPKGKQALLDLIKIVIAKSQINRIFTNMITGEIETEEESKYWDRPKPNCMCLDQCLKTDIQFFRDHFSEIENIYNKNRVGEVVFQNRTDKQDSLYRILDIVYQETRYLETNCFVYINEEESSLLFSFENDKNSIYAATANVQISNNVVSAMNLFREKVKLSNHDRIEFCYSTEDEKSLEELTDLLKQRSKTIISTEEVESNYFKDRYLLDGELRDILMHCNDYKPERIIILSAYMKDFLQDNGLIDYLLSSNFTTTISFIYNSNEYGVDNSIKWILGNSSEKDKDRLIFSPLPDKNRIDYTQIKCEPGFVISIHYEEVKDNHQRSLLKEIANISFNSQKINDACEMLAYKEEATSRS